MNVEKTTFNKIVRWYNEAKLAIFIGAGVSRLEPISCLGWEELAKNILLTCNPLINFETHEISKRYTDHRMLITMCYHYLKGNGGVSEFFKCMEDALKEEKDYKNHDIYYNLSLLDIPFITTNADTHFDKYFNEDSIKYKLEDFNAQDIFSHKNYLFKIHGSYSDRDHMVFTIDKYFERYTDDNFTKFISYFFENYHILFLGYSLTETELLYPIFKSKNINPKKCKHLMLKGFRKSEEELIVLENMYYNIIGVEIIPFSLDGYDYDNLSILIKAWVKLLTGIIKND